MHKSWQDYDQFLYYSYIIMNKKNATIHGLLMDYCITMNHELSSFFPDVFPFSDETYHQLTHRVLSGCTAGVDQICFTHGASEQKLHAATHSEIPSRGLTYPTLGRGKSSSTVPFLGDMLVSWRVYHNASIFLSRYVYLYMVVY